MAAASILMDAELVLLLALLARAIWSHRWAKGAERALAAGRPRTAEARYRRAHRTARLALLPGVRRSAAHRLANLLRGQQRWEQAAAILERTLAGRRFGHAAARMHAILHNDLALLRVQQGRSEDAAREFTAAEATWSEAAPCDASFATTLENHAAFLQRQGDGTSALRARQRALEIREAQFERDPAAELQLHRQLARDLGSNGQYAAAEVEWRRVEHALAHMPGDVTGLRLEAMQALAEGAERQGRQRESDAWFGRWVELLRSAREVTPEDLARAQLTHGERLLRAGTAGEAEASARRVLNELAASALGPRTWALHLSARARAAQQDWTGAAAACADALALSPTEDDGGGPRRFELMVLLAEVRTKTWDLPAAELAYREALAYLEPRVAAGHPWLQWAQGQLARLRHGGPSAPVH